MKTFEKWLNKSNYEFIVRHGSFSTVCSIRGEYGKCVVFFNHFKKGCIITDDNNYETEVPSVKKAIELVNFLVGGEC